LAVKDVKKDEYDVEIIEDRNVKTATTMPSNPLTPDRRRRALLQSSMLAASTGLGPAFAQGSFPNQPVRIIVPFTPGGAADALPRLVGQRLSEVWGQPVVIENRAGASGNIGMELGARAAPNGYTLISAPTGNLAVNPHLFPNLSFDPFKSFTPVAMLANVQNVLVVHPSVPAKTVTELVALAKSRPGALTYGSGGSGSQSHIGVEIFKAMTGSFVLHIPYKGVADMLKDLMGGELSMALAQLPSVIGHIQSGRLRAIGLASRQRSPLLPNVAAIAETAGLERFESVSWYSLVAPAGTPKEITQAIAAEVSRALQTPALRDKLQGLGAEGVGGTSEQLLAVMRSDYERYGEVIRRLKLKPD
jgi:tripartite-type tricarboxylate transporter receptor subunit TctC